MKEKPESEPTIRILKETSCPSLSEQSTLKYQIAENESGIQFRITENSGTGRFNSVWVPLADILTVLKDPITLQTIATLFKGQSTNNAGFLLAALKAEGLVRPTKENLRRYECVDPKVFMTVIEKLNEPKPNKKGAKKDKNDPDPEPAAEAHTTEAAIPEFVQ